MKLSTQTSYVIDKYGMEEGIRALAKAGYDAIDYSFFDMNKFSTDKIRAVDIRLPCFKLW